MNVHWDQIALPRVKHRNLNRIRRRGFSSFKIKSEQYALKRAVRTTLTSQTNAMSEHEIGRERLKKCWCLITYSEMAIRRRSLPTQGHWLEKFLRRRATEKTATKFYFPKGKNNASRSSQGRPRPSLRINNLRDCPIRKLERGAKSLDILSGLLSLCFSVASPSCKDVY